MREKQGVVKKGMGERSRSEMLMKKIGEEEKRRRRVGEEGGGGWRIVEFDG